MTLFLSLYLGHVLGDFVFQPGRLVIAKRQGVRGVLLHTGIVVACTALVLASHLERTWPVILLAGLAHFGVEHLTIGARRSDRTSGLTVFLLDQGVHIVSLVLLAMVFSEPLEPALAFLPVSADMLRLVAGVATVAFAGSILVFEVDLARSAPDPGEGDAILGLDGARAYGVAERAGGLLLACLTPWPVLGLAAFAPRVAYAFTLPGGRRASQLAAAVTGLVLCAAVWALICLPLDAA